MPAYSQPMSTMIRLCLPRAAKRQMPWHYKGTVSFTLDEHRIATLYGLVWPRKFTKATWRDIEGELRKAGAVGAIWSRHDPSGRERPYSARVRNPLPGRPYL